MSMRRWLTALVFLLPGSLLVAATTAQSQTGGVATAPSIDECRQRIAVSAPGIDADCLRQVYARPIAEWPAPTVDAGAVWQELAPLPDAPPAPADNPQTPEKIALGKRLFEDPRLSRSGQIACASCHDRQLGWGDGRSVSFGHDRQAGKRNAMNVSMAAFSSPLFWDGRAATLEAQALHPIQDSAEMAFSPRELEKRLNRETDYPTAFAQVFGEKRITMSRVAQALASYQRSLVPRFNRFDRFLDGQRGVLTDQQLWGLHLFRTQARCMNCHSGPALTDNRFHNLGLHFYGRSKEDLGRYRVTGDPADSGKFRTPTLRGVGKTGPYMHNGGFMELRGVVNMYNAGMPRPQPRAGQENDPLFPQTDPLLQPLDLHRTELEAITAFLQTL
ncbi:cytochrome-c peroxidase [Pseudoxanthomonas japonensis]|nr:cytochrome c peroxidase [Pseudoxanthomonas japonensis]